MASVQVLVPPATAETAEGSKKTVALLCNVKKAEAATAAAKFPAEFTLKPNSSRIGALFKERTREVLAGAVPLRGGDALRHYFSGKPVRVGAFEVPLSAFDLGVVPGEGYEVAEKGGVFVAIRKERDVELVAEGLVRDVARRLQALRKEKGYVPAAVLASAEVAGLEADDLQLLEQRRKEIAFLVRVKKVELSAEKGTGPGWSESDLDGKPLYLKVG